MCHFLVAHRLLRDDEIVISVADQGPGVPPADRETIFDRFTQLNTGGRAGLGLTIAKTFVEAHGERVWYEEVPDGGARFVFSLPRESEGGGAGLGLAICRGIVAAHGGRIWAENRKTGGAVFRFTIPIEGTPPTLTGEEGK